MEYENRTAVDAVFHAMRLFTEAAIYYRSVGEYKLSQDFTSKVSSMAYMVPDIINSYPFSYTAITPVKEAITE